MNKIIYATLGIGLFVSSADALKRSASSFESIGRATLNSSISQANSRQLISLLTQKDVKMLIAHDEELLEITAEKASSLASAMNAKEKAQMRICLEELQAIHDEDSESSESEDSFRIAQKKQKTNLSKHTQKHKKRSKIEDDDNESGSDSTYEKKAAALLGVTGILAQTSLNITAQLQERRFERDKANRTLFASTADALLGTDNNQIANTIAIRSETERPVVAKTLAENIGEAFKAIANLFRK